MDGFAFSCSSRIVLLNLQPERSRQSSSLQNIASLAMAAMCEKQFGFISCVLFI